MVAEPGPAVWSHDGRHVATARAGKLWLFDVETGASRSIVHPALVADLVWSPDDRRLALQTGAANSFENDFELWDVGRGVLLHREAAGSGTVDVHFGPTFSPDGRIVFFAGKLDAHTGGAYEERPSLKLLDADRAAVWRDISVAHPKIPPSCTNVSDACLPWDRLGPPLPTNVVFDRSLRFAAIRWSLETPLQAWDLARDEPIDIRSQERVLAGVALSADEAWLVWGEPTGIARYSRAGHRRGSLIVPRFAGAQPLAFAMHPSRSELLLLTGYTVGRWDLERGRRIWETTLRARQAPVGTYVDPSRPRVAYVTGGAHVLAALNHPYLLDAATGRLVEPAETQDDEPSRVEQTGPGSAVDAEQRELGAWEDGDRGLRAVHPDAGEVMTLEPSHRPLARLVLSADRRRLVLADGRRGDVVWFDLAKGERHVLCEPIDPLPGAGP